MDLLGERCLGCGSNEAILCRGCRAGLPPAPGAQVVGVDRVLAAYDYRGLARDLVLSLKLRHLRACAEPLALGLVSVVMRQGLLGSVITWVPGRRRDVLERGFDHAHLIAAAVGRALGLPVVRCLTRVGKTQDQASLGRSERSSNMAGAFAAISAPREVVVVDDLLTTGATARASAEALRATGTRVIEVLAAARA